MNNIYLKILYLYSFKSNRGGGEVAHGRGGGAVKDKKTPLTSHIQWQVRDGDVR